jgi:diguanylate cyclase (GGDEF)-like protein
MNTGRMEVRVLFIDDSQPDVDAMLRVLRKGRICDDWRRVSDPRALRVALRNFNASVVLARFPAREFAGTEALKIVRKTRPDLPFVFATGAMSKEQTIRVLREGAADVITRAPGKLVPAVRRALAQADERLAREHAQRRLAMQYEITRILAEGGTLREATARIFKTICEHEGFDAAALWKVVPDSDVLHCIDIWTNDDPKMAEFAAGSRAFEIGPGVGLAGRAWARRAPVWVADLSILKNLPLPAVKADLGSGMAFPVTLHGEVKGVMVFFGFEVREEDADLLEMFLAIGNQIGQFMDRDEQRAHIMRLNRVYAVLGEINATIMRVEDRQRLFDEACRIAVEKGNFGIAWIGEYDRDSYEVKPVAWGGLEIRELVAFKSTARADVPGGQGTVGQAIRTKKPVYTNDLSAQPGVGGKRRQEALRRGYRSQITLPLLLDGDVAGILSLFAMEADFFTGDEVQLLTELAENIAFALEHLAKKERIDYLANRDEVTGIANRNLLSEHLLNALAQANRTGHLVAVAVLRVENFRLINESLGHNVSDALLKNVAERLCTCIRKTDMLARLGGGEFVLVLPLKSDALMVTRVMNRVASNVFDDAAAVETLQRALNEVSQPMKVEGHELQPKCSVGVALYPQDGINAESLLKNAAAAATHAREHSGENFQFYTADLNVKLSQRLTLQTALRQASKNNEFSLYYQPRLNLLTGESSGAEGLLRWNHPEDGVVLPGRFIANLEETGQIIDVGRWVMEQAVADHQRWRAIHPQPPRIAVNVSALQLEQKDFPASVGKLLRDARVSGATGLDLEITESLIMQDLQENIAKLRAVRDMGVDIIIDDFGTGYSSLSYLAKLPGNTLKIDRSFVQDMEGSQDTLTIVTTIISLAHSLGLKVVAEGIETESQKNTLLLLSCDEIQGYLVSHPLPCAQFEAWWRSRANQK